MPGVSCVIFVVIVTINLGNLLYLSPVERNSSEHGLRDPGPLQLVPHPLVDLGGDLCVGGHLRIQGLAESPADRRVVQILLVQGLLRQEPVHSILLVQDLRHYNLLVDQLRTNGTRHQARVETGKLGTAWGLATVGQGNRGRRLLGRAARDGLLTEAQVVGAGRREV